MKKFILSAIAVSMVASPLAATAASAGQYQPQQRHETVVRHQPGRTTIVQRDYHQSRPQYRNNYRNDWRRGERFDYRQARNYRVINDYRGRHLKAPPRGYRYVQSGNDALLVGISSGVIAAILAGALR
ncbi:MAG: RcnB family protein [Sphingomonas sp.]|jgi:Ni/Co efflux regulator RcnB|uniref:RcnB family protein n=1 Tax=Sphingomonas sp. TaxID=28214 RepID=UPI003566D908